jgi:hypothetical protein
MRYLPGGRALTSSGVEPDTLLTGRHVKGRRGVLCYAAWRKLAPGGQASRPEAVQAGVWWEPLRGLRRPNTDEAFPLTKRMILTSREGAR